ncbi:hypothetical protein C7R42_09930, partial [Staphylococcus aureus]
MKNKLLVLSLGALCVSQIWESNRASAVVSGEKNPYVSESLKLTGSKSTGVTPVSNPHLTLPTTTTEEY